MLPNWSLSGLAPLLSPLLSVARMIFFCSSLLTFHQWLPTTWRMTATLHTVATASQYYGSWLHFQPPLHLAPFPSLFLLFLKEAEVHLAVAGFFWSTCPLDLPMIHSFMILKYHSERPFLTFEKELFIYLAASGRVAALRILVASCGTFPCSALA